MAIPSHLRAACLDLSLYVNVRQPTSRNVWICGATFPRLSPERLAARRRKTMAREGDFGDTRLVFQPDSDAKLAAELERMRALGETSGDGSAEEQWRLNPGFCFIKLCRPVAQPRLARTRAGRRDVSFALLLDLLLASPATEGPRGGRVLTYKTVSRRFDNSLFIELVRGSWIGSRAKPPRRSRT